MHHAKALLLLASLLQHSVAQDRASLDGVWSLAHDAAAGTERTYDQTITVPSAFETVLGHAFDGIAWYRRTLPLSTANKDRSVWIEFGAVATHATVFCNGVELGEHLGGWTPFAVEVTSALQWNGKDTLEVRVDERVGHNTQGFLPIVQPHFGGIWQSVGMALDRGAALDRTKLTTFGLLGADDSGRCRGRVAVRTSTQGIARAANLRVEVVVRDGARSVGSFAAALSSKTDLDYEFAVPAVRPWSPDTPNLYSVSVRLLDGDDELDCEQRSIGFRSLAADGTTILWNRKPLSVRGVLHWGFSPPQLAPPSDEAHWRTQLEDLKSLGFNTLKCCLFVPPPCVYDLCDELGLLCWQEYPTWHPKLDQAHKQELLREYGEFFAADGSHPSVAFRSITCETGHDADLDVVTALFDACHAAVPETLVVDDSSWIGWQRITDFWDEHPYGNNRWWPRRLSEFAQHIEKNGKKPLLLGECLAADTWVDRAAFEALPPPMPWWRPICLQDQVRFEDWVVSEFG
ncbi:MAG: sugar-binding domain-containing protein, partial [Planctomycetota bacterium]